MHHLSEGFLELIMNGQDVDMQPIFQILAVKKLTSFSKAVDDTERYRLRVSDGRTTNTFIMLASPLNHLVYSNELTEFSIVRIKKYFLTSVKNNNRDCVVMIILDLEVIDPGYNIGRALGYVGISSIEEQLSAIDIDG